MPTADLDDNTSVWAATTPAVDPLPPQQGDERADVVIVGGGFTGLSTAWHLSHRFPDRRIVVLEARRVGNGASGRNGGMALHWINGVDVHDADRARRLYQVTTDTIGWIADVIRDHAPEVPFRRDGCLELYTDARRAEEAHHKAELLGSWGLPIRYVAGADLPIRAVGAVGGVLDPTTGQLHGLAFLNGMRRVLVARGVAIREQSPVVAIEAGATHRVVTAAGAVTAPFLVLATNGYTPWLGWFKTGVFPLHSHVVATEPLALDRWRALGWGDAAGFTDDLDRIAYASLTPDGRLVFGGGGNGAYSYYYGGRTAPPRPPEAQWAFVRSVLDRYFPDAADVRIDHRWTGTLGLTMSRVCSMGLTGAHRNIGYALGYSGHGVVLANLAGRVLCDLYSDAPEGWRDLPFFERPLWGIPPEPLRWAGYQVFTRLTGRSPRRYEADR
ncbi:MAG: FAD-dependent oxidoreductase [Myxococcota bacterium]